MGHTALLIVDVQLGVFMRKHHDGLEIYREEALLENINALIRKAKAANAPVVYVQHMYTDNPLMEKGQPLWEVHPDIKPEQDDIIIEKHYADAFYDSALDDTLKKLGVTDLVLTGLQTAYCVDTTCRRAHSLGYKVFLVSDGHSTWKSDILTAEQIICHHNEVLGSQFAELLKTEDVRLI